MTPPAVRHWVYRCYDADDLLLYVGCTAQVKTRLGAHRAGSGSAEASRWLQVSMTRYEVEGPYPTKQDGRDAESNAIADEQPLFNRQGRRIPRWQILPRVAEYLIEHGHRALAIETACTCWGEFRITGVIDPSCAAHIAERRDLTQAEISVIFEQAEILARTG